LLLFPDLVGEAICSEEYDRGDQASNQAERPVIPAAKGFDTADLRNAKALLAELA
jgi:hypothetical protein